MLSLFISDYLDIWIFAISVGFDGLMEGVNVEKSLKYVPEHVTGRIRYNSANMLKLILFEFMSNRYISLRKLVSTQEITDAKYWDNPFQAVNFKIDVEGTLRCPAG